VYSGSSLLAEWNFQSVGGLYKNFTRMSPSEFEFLMNLKISKKDTAFRKAISVSRKVGTDANLDGSVHSFRSSSRTYCFLILLKCIGCFGAPNYFFSFIKFDKYYDTFLSPLHLTVTKPYSTDSHHSS